MCFLSITYHEISLKSFSVAAFPLVVSRKSLRLWTVSLPPWMLLYSSPCFWIDTLVKCTYLQSQSFGLNRFLRTFYEAYMLSISLTESSYLTVQKRQKPCEKRYAFSGLNEVT